MTLRLESSVLVDGGVMPTCYTCDGADISPPLSWYGVPNNARSLVLIVDDPDAPDPAAPKAAWVHWLLYNIPAYITGLAENIKELPMGTCEGLNDWKRTGYGGSCPPIGRHRYFFKLFALDTTLDLKCSPTKAQIKKAMRGHILSQSTLILTYQRAGK